MSGLFGSMRIWLKYIGRWLVFDWKVQLFPLSFERQMPEVVGLGGMESAAPRPPPRPPRPPRPPAFAVESPAPSAVDAAAADAAALPAPRPPRPPPGPAAAGG